eukprot:TRINITY_DN3607_c0_g1_i1.p1 TRINITY_DN3607_c0_g1~~TRINITY_DN3607_c0_g1_i1.p1  ORF type:complete len:1066 (-),score=312.92 TRINITY_DN3607_c0_g1_i1:83-2947(-)
MSDLAAKAIKLGKHLNDRSNDPAISPFTRDMLRKAAGNLKDRAQELKEVGNAALKDPSLLPQLAPVLQSLKKEIQAAKALATQSAPEAPAMDNLRRLLPLIEKMEQKAIEIPSSSKQPAKYERAEKELKDAAQELMREIKPMPKFDRDAKKIEEALKDQILAARKNLKTPTNPALHNEIDDATQKLLDALNNLKKRNPDGKLTPEEKNELQNALNNLKKTFGCPILTDPRDKEQEAYERLNDLVDGVKKAVREENPKMLNNQIRGAVAAAKDLADKMTDPENLKKLPPYQRQAKEQGAKDILDSLPRIVKNAGPVLKNPKDEGAAEDLMDALRRLQRAADKPNRRKDEQEIRDNLADALAALKKTQAAAKAGDAKGVADGNNDLANALANLRKAGDRMKERNPDPRSIEQPLSELEKMFEKFKKVTPEAARGDVGATKEMDNTVPAIQKALDDLGKLTRARDISPLIDVEDAVDRVIAATDSDDPTRLTPALKDLTQKINDLGTFVETLPDPKARQAGQKAIEQMKPALKDFLQKAKELQQKPLKPGIHDELNDIANRIKAPLAEFKKVVDPKPLDRDPEAAGFAVKRALENLRNAKNTGDPEAIRKALDDLRDALGHYNDIIDNVSKKVPDPKKRALLDDELGELKELVGDLRRVDPTDQRALRNLLDQIPDRMDDWQDRFRNTDKDDAIEAIAKTNNILATMGSLDENDMDLGDLLGTAGELSNLMRGLIGDTSGIARKLGTNPSNLTAAAKAALDLDNFLKKLEGEEEEVLKPIELPETPLFAPHSDEYFEEISLSSAKTFDQVLAAVANEMHQAAKNLSAEADSLAKELASLAKAARSGNKQDMLVAAKAASAFVIAFCKQLDILAQKIPGRNNAERREQDNLYRYQQALRNYGTQLKILSSVKAASIEDSKDTDASLTTLTKNLGEVVGAGLHSMAVTRDAIFGGKVPK